MEDVNKFGSDIQKFRNGDFDYQYSFDSVGNLYFKDPSSEISKVFLKLPILNSNYDIKKMNQLVNMEFEEFVTPKKEVVESIRETSVPPATVSNSEFESEITKLKSNLMANRDVIIELRIKRGEGRTSEDFLTEFPFFPKPTSPLVVPAVPRR